MLVTVIVVVPYPVPGVAPEPLGLKAKSPPSCVHEFVPSYVLQLAPSVVRLAKEPVPSTQSRVNGAAVMVRGSAWPPSIG